MTFPSNAQRSDWFSQQYEAWTPTDEPEKTEYLAELATEAENGPGIKEEATW
jgi:hypothetical protein